MIEVNQINSAFQNYFRTSKRIRIHNRAGVFVVVDDREDAVNLVRKLFVSRGEQQEVVSAKNVSEAKKQVEFNNNGEDVKAIIIDIGLEGDGVDGDGVNLAEWLTVEHPIIPFVFSTGKSNKAKYLKKKFPGVDIFIKGKDNINELAEALGLNFDEELEEASCIPMDSIPQSEKEKSSSGVFRFVRNFF